MGNRATITLENDTQDRGLYLHWNGGEDKVASFLAETKKRMSFGRGVIESESDIITFYAIFYGVVREYIGYCSAYKERAPMSVSMVVNQNVRAGSGDNGCYIINSDFTCSRLDLDKTDVLGEFFEEVHHALCVIVDEEETKHQNRNPSIKDLEAQLIHVKEIAKNAAMRKARLIEATLDYKVERAVEGWNAPA